MGAKPDKALTDHQPRVGWIVRRCPATCKIVYCTVYDNELGMRYALRVTVNT